MFRSESVTLGMEKRHLMRHRRHGCDATVTGRDGTAVTVQHVGNQRLAEPRDTMTLLSSKWSEDGNFGVVKHGERELYAKRGGRRDLTKSSVMPSRRAKW